MCRFCEQSCDRDGGERPCELSDAEFAEAYDEYAEADESLLHGGDDQEDEGVSCVRCGRWHSGMTPSDEPTSYCEVCAAREEPNSE